MQASEPRPPIDLARAADFSLGALRVRPSSREVIANGAPEQLEPRVMQVLVALATRRGEVVTRDDLIEQCWDGRVVGDDAVGRCIARLRRLAEMQGGFALETIARVGYRLTETPPLAPPVADPPTATTDDSPANAPTATDDVRVTAGAPQRNAPARIAIIAAALIGVGSVIWLAIVFSQTATEQHAEHERIKASVVALVATDQYGDAFMLARPLVQSGMLTRDPAFRETWMKIVVPMKPHIEADGVTIEFKPYAAQVHDWVHGGVTPLTGFIDAPRGTLLVRLSKPGFRTQDFAIANPGPVVDNDPLNPVIVNRKLSTITLPLIAEGALANDVVLVPHTDMPVFYAGWTTDMSAGNFRFDVPAFAIDRDEVTNRAFKEFIDAGGYDAPSYWQDLRFDADGRQLSWPEARARFVDTTGRPGPAGWQLSTYPTGQESLPVTGISWYEAVAYARFRKQQLPTIHHWVRAAFGPYDPHFSVAPMVGAHSRFSATGPIDAHEDIGIGPWGTHQMAGNVREWVLNFAGKRALALGGAWSDYASESQSAYATDPMMRAPAIGLRLMQTLDGTTVDPALLAPVHLLVDEPQHERTPVTDAAFEVMRAQFTSAHRKIASASVNEVTRTSLYIAEEVTLTLSDASTAVIFIVRPLAPHTPLQPIIYAPAADCCGVARPNRNTLDQLRVAGFIVASGRALVMPIWWGSYERALPFEPDAAAFADRQRRQALEWEQDLRVTLDYLETRADIDAKQAGFFGLSRGATRNAIVLALDERIRAAVLLSGGIEIANTPHPMVDLVNYAPRVHAAVLMINGRFDHHFPYRESQQRLFALLGSSPGEKAHIVYDTGHFSYPPNTVARDASNWFDRWLGVPR
jgi:DNA-binding winged helix-turn-helix (wHTH) protein/dienelactone hydrolase